MSETSQQNHEPGKLEPLGTEDGQVLVAQQKKNTVILWSMFGILLLIAAAVFFVLPNIVTPPDLSTETQNTSTIIASVSQTEQISPFEEAQRLRQREAAQAILAELLTLQESLEEKEVLAWAENSFLQGLDIASEGDTAYREQRFTDAEEFYQQSFDTLLLISNSSDQIVAELLMDGSLALQNENSESALAAFELAMTISPENEAAVNGIERARVLDEVIDLFLQANMSIDQQDFESALALYNQASVIDPMSEKAKQSIEEMSQAIIERNFTALMSQGYAALQSDNPQQAEDFFNQALSIKPSAADATTALAQVKDQISSAAINEQLNAATHQIQNENWQAALDAFTQALLIDPNLVTAQEGSKQSQSRLNLDQFLEVLIADPLALADDVYYEQSVQVYTDALRIPEGGPRFVEQMSQAKNYLEQARVPLPLSIYSDSITNVTVLRHGNIGQFTQHSLRLIPGRYVAVGTRDGYRDVRIEFEVSFLSSETEEYATPSIEVICQNPI